MIGMFFVVGGLLQGRAVIPLRCEAPRPYLRDQPVVVYSIVAVLFLLWLTFVPGINNLGQVLVIVARGAGRGGHRSTAAADGAGISARPGEHVTARTHRAQRAGVRRMNQFGTPSTSASSTTS